MAAWECSAGVTGQHYHTNCTVGLLHRKGDAIRNKTLGSYGHLLYRGWGEGGAKAIPNLLGEFPNFKAASYLFISS